MRCAVMAMFLVAILASGCLNTAEWGLARTVQVHVDGGRFGSGVFVADDLVLTARHVAENAGRLTITTPDGKTYECGAVRLCERADLALVSVATPDRERRVRVRRVILGQLVLHVGSPHGMWPTVSQGIVSCLDRDVLGLGMDLIQVDCPGCGPGSSGGPVFDTAGGLVGIVIGGITGGLDMCVAAEDIRGFLDEQR